MTSPLGGEDPLAAVAMATDTFPVWASPVRLTGAWWYNGGAHDYVIVPEKKGRDPSPLLPPLSSLPHSPHNKPLLVGLW